MDFPALRDLLKTNRLYPEERAELVTLFGRSVRLEGIDERRAARREKDRQGFPELKRTK